MRTPLKVLREQRNWSQAGLTSASWWWVALGLVAVATAFFAVAALMLALRGHDTQPWTTLAILSGVAVGVATVFAAGLGKQQGATSAVPSPTSARRAAFVSLSSMWLALCVFALTNVHLVLDITARPLWAGLAAAIGATLSIAAMTYALLLYLTRETDEYQRLLLMRAALIAAALTFFVLTAWGLFEHYVGAPHFPASLALAPFCLFFAIANWWVRGRT
jgi:hypothetical protein